MHLIAPPPGQYRGSSFHSSLARCMQEAGYKYRTPEVLAPSTEVHRPFALGQLAHVGLAHFLVQRDTAKGHTAHHDTMAFTKPSDVFTPPHAMRGYAFQHGTSDCLPSVEPAVEKFMREYATDPLVTVAVEHVLQMTIPDGDRTWDYSTRVDWIAIDSAGRYWIIDHKTSQKMKPSTLESLSLDIQTLGLHCLGLAHYGDAFGGVMIQALDLSPPYTTSRTRVPLAPGALFQFPQQIARLRREWESLEDTPIGQYPKALHNLVCVHRYGKCDFFDACRFGVGS